MTLIHPVGFLNKIPFQTKINNFDTPLIILKLQYDFSQIY